MEPVRTAIQSDAVLIGVARSSPHAVQVSLFQDPRGRDGKTLLRDWYTLPCVAEAAARAGARVTVVQAASRGEILEQNGVMYHFVARELTRLVTSLHPDVVHLHGFIAPVSVWTLSRALSDVPVMVQDHAMRVPSGFRRVIWKTVSRSIDAVAFTTLAQAKPFFEAGVFPAGLRVFEVMEGSSFFTPGDQPLARRQSGIDGDPCFLWVGHLNTGKDPLTALRAFELAAPRMRDPRFWFFYIDAPLLDEVRRTIAESPVLRERVTLIGARPHDEMENLFRAADFLVQSSRFEGSGYSALESLACGTPALLSDIPSFRRISGNGEVGSITPCGDYVALGESMVRLAGGDRVAGRRRAREWFEANLSFDVIGRELTAAYESLTTRK